jgi:hypothetical protein
MHCGLALRHATADAPPDVGHAAHGGPIATGAPMWTAELPATELRTLKLLGAPPTAVVVTLAGSRRAVVLHPDTGAVLGDQSSDDGSVGVGVTRDLLLLDTVKGGTGRPGSHRAGALATAARVTVEGETLLAQDPAAGTVAVLDPDNGAPVWSAPAPQLGGFSVVGERLIFWSDAGLLSVRWDAGSVLRGSRGCPGRLRRHDRPSRWTSGPGRGCGRSPGCPRIAPGGSSAWARMPCCSPRATRARPRWH